MKTRFWQFCLSLRSSLKQSPIRRVAQSLRHGDEIISYYRMSSEFPGGAHPWIGGRCSPTGYYSSYHMEGGCHCL